MIRFLFIIFALILFSNCNQPQNTMILIPKGNFKVGINPSDKILTFLSDQTTNANAQPMQDIHIPSFYIDRIEVTYAQFNQFKKKDIYQAKSNEPVRKVSWYEADAFCLWANKRLPTEFEWEKAARGTDGRLFVWGNKFDKSFANFGKSIQPSGSFFKDKSVYGVWDLNGNLSEWTSDYYQPYPKSKHYDENYGNKFKVIRGGSFYKRSHGFMKEFVMVTHRNFAPPSMKALDTGFRCARTKKS